MKKIEIFGITYIEPLDGSTEWYYGSDYAAGDLYEAEEAYRNGYTFEQNRVLFIHYPDGEVVEPVKAQPNQYLGRPVFYDGKIINLLVDFSEGEIQILAYDHESKKQSPIVTLPLTAVKDCYNLLLRTSPIMLTRHNKLFEVIWPERMSYIVSEREGLYFRDGDKLYFQEWFEDPDYREELVVRDFHTGEILERHPGSIRQMPDGQNWLLV